MFPMKNARKSNNVMGYVSLLGMSRYPAIQRTDLQCTVCEAKHAHTDTILSARQLHAHPKQTAMYVHRATVIHTTAMMIMKLLIIRAIIPEKHIWSEVKNARATDRLIHQQTNKWNTCCRVRHASDFVCYYAMRQQIGLHLEPRVCICEFI